MPSVGPNYPGAVTQTNLGQVTRLKFDQPDAILADDNIVATSAISPATYRLTWVFRMSQFDMQVPAGSIIVGFELTFECNTNITISGQCRDGTAQLLVGGVVMGQKLSSGSDWTAGSHTRTIGGAADLWGWTSPPVDDVNGTDFEVRFDAQVASDNSASFDWFKLKVYYTTTTFYAFEGSACIGVGGSMTLYKNTPIVGGTGYGVGVGGTSLRKAKPLVIAGGMGAGGAGSSHIKRTVSGTGGAGIGGTYMLQKYFLGGNGGAGIGGHADSRQGIIQIASGGLGVGGDGNRKAVPLITGGLGEGGTADFYRRWPRVGTGGAGVGASENPFGRRRFTTTEGGWGVSGDTGTHRIRQGYIARGGVGAGGAVGIHRTLANGSTDPEDDIERSHRGPVTRRMVFDAIRKALVEGPLDKYRVYIADDEPDMTNVPPGETFAVIIPRAANNEQGDTTGGGSIGTMRTDGCEVRIYSHSSIDPFPKSTAWALKINTGAMERARKIRRTLHLLDLIDDAGWALLTEPMRATSTGNGTFRRANPQWGYYAETFEVVYTEYLG